MNACPPLSSPAPLAIASSPKTHPTSVRGSLGAVEVAWPTLALSLGTVTTTAAAVGLGLSEMLPMWASGFIAALSAFAAFTAMHDASHKSVAKRRWVSEVVGRLASLLLVAPFPAFRYVHLEHHKHTNDPVRDPDHWSGRGPAWLLPLRWLTQDLHYYVLYFRVRNSRPRRERLETLLTFGALYGSAIALVATGYGMEVLLLWLLPARAAIVLLAVAFDYLPHRPHTVLAKDDRYRATHILDIPWLTPLFLCQNYHLVHHLYPGVPFYRYPRVYRERRDEMVERGAKIITLTP